MKSNFSDSPNHGPSMKVPPKRKGNFVLDVLDGKKVLPLNESPSEKEGKWLSYSSIRLLLTTLNESPSEKEGKCLKSRGRGRQPHALNESPSEKEGK